MKIKYVLPVLAIVIAGFAYYMMTPKGPINVEKAEVNHFITANSLFSEFNEDEVKAAETYVPEVIQVTGNLIEVSETEAGYQLTLDSGSIEGNVSCNLQSSAQLSDFKIGDAIAVKGICTGFLFDVIIDQCLIIK